MSATAPSIIDLRVGSARDIDAVERVMATAFDPRYGEAWTRNQCLGLLALPGVWLTLAERDEQVAGFALTRAIVDEAELLLIATAPQQRRCGVASALLRAVIGEARDRGLNRVHLEVRAGNEAVKLYRATGFAKVGERRGYYRGRDGEAHDAHTYSRIV